jgi:hypothetical protein
MQPQPVQKGIRVPKKVLIYPKGGKQYPLGCAFLFLKQIHRQTYIKKTGLSTTITMQYED